MPRILLFIGNLLLIFFFFLLDDLKGYKFYLTDHLFKLVEIFSVIKQALSWNAGGIPIQRIKLIFHE